MSTATTNTQETMIYGMPVSVFQTLPAEAQKALADAHAITAKAEEKKYPVLGRNNTSLIGRMGKDASDCSISKMNIKGEEVTRLFFRLAVPRFEGSTETSWVPVLAYGKTAEAMIKHVKKGAILSVEAPLDIFVKEDGSEEFRLDTFRVRNGIRFITMEGNGNQSKAPATKPDFGSMESANVQVGLDEDCGF